MARTYQVISGDGHVETPPDGWRKYVPEQWRDRAPRLIRLPDGSDGWLVEGQPMLHNGQNIKGRGPVKFANASYYNEDGSLREGAGDARQRLREQDLDGIDAEVLFAPCSSPASSSRSPTSACTARSCRPTTPGWPRTTARWPPTG